jgi:tetrahydromethanopterin S-methyltransferase subunit G
VASQESKRSISSIQKERIAMSDKEQKEEILSRLIKVKQRVDTHDQQILEAHDRIDGLEEKVEEIRKEAYLDRRKFGNKIKRTTWELSKMAMGQRKIVEQHSFRLTDTKKRLDKVEKVVRWVGYTIAGLFVATLVGAVLKFVFGVNF